jgi:antitoxin (DNA-binding transcriptional repressor) of toxin-antitoxin stability system
MAEKEVNVTELRQNLPTYLARVRCGERIRVRSRGRIIAEIAPPTPEKGEAVAARARLRNSVLRFEKPTAPVLDPLEWDMNR